MQSVISSEEVRKITGGRTPLVPVVYEEALKALEACLTLDDAKYWSDKADALAAWAKIFRSNEAKRKAAALKLHAYRRMYELAAELRPPHKRKRREPGPVGLMKQHGLLHQHATAASFVGRMPQKEFKTLLEMPAPPSPITVNVWGRGNKNWITARSYLSSLYSELKTLTPTECARDVAPNLVLGIKTKARQVIDWLDEFERHLPKP